MLFDFADLTHISINAVVGGPQFTQIGSCRRHTCIPLLHFIYPATEAPSHFVIHVQANKEVFKTTFIEK